MKNLIILISLIILLTSCQEVIDVDLNSSSPQVVIEGNINSNNKEAIVKISYSINFDETNNFPKIENYLVKIKDNINEYILDEIEPGIYQKDIPQIETGAEFELLVEGNQQQFSSKSSLQPYVNFDSLIVIKNTTSTSGPGSGGKKGFNYEVKVRYKDPIGQKNYYRFVLSLNGDVSDNNYVYDDRLTDGKSIETTLLGINNKFEPGDTIKIEMQTIDRNVYEYFKGFGTNFGKFQPSSTPANPLNNIIGSKLGYFNVHTSQIKSFILP